MSRYFKLVCFHDPGIILAEFLKGRARFGWSPPGTDLRLIQTKERASWSVQERVTWRYTNFLLQRIHAGDRIVVQAEQPMVSFLIGEVVEPGYEFSGDWEDFNHVLHVRPLTADPIPLNSKEVSLALKHNLTKRGQYYEIYPEDSLRELDLIVEKAASKKLDLTIRTEQDDRDRTLKATKEGIVHTISRQWPSKNFEKFCEMLCDAVEYIEVKERKDSGKGWDLRIRFVNPLTQTTLFDDVPLQCKNFDGEVVTTQPIDDLERSVTNSKSNLALLFILGDLTDEFLRALDERQAMLSRKLGRDITFEVIDKDRIAELYAAYIGRSVEGASGGN